MGALRNVADKRALVMRLRRIEGQVRGIQRLIEDEKESDDIAQQLSAARKALDKTYYVMVGNLMAQGEVSGEEVADLLIKFS